jgi:hypothetical protein
MAPALPIFAALALAATLTAPGAQAFPGSNNRLHAAIASNVYTLQQRSGCIQRPVPPGVEMVNDRLITAARDHTFDLMEHRELGGDIGSDGSTPQDRALAAGYHGVVSETTAVFNQFATNAVEIMNQWYYDPDYYAIMTNCANTQIGVWSESVLDHYVLVAVYGQPAYKGPMPKAGLPPD